MHAGCPRNVLDGFCPQTLWIERGITAIPRISGIFNSALIDEILGHMPMQVDPGAGIVQLLNCDFSARCRVKNCRARNATTIARKLDRSGVYIRQLELCDGHARMVARREFRKGREIVDRRKGWSP